METYVIFQNAGKTETGMTTRFNWNSVNNDGSQPGFKFDDSGKLMTVVREFDAASAEDARAEYQAFLESL